MPDRRDLLENIADRVFLPDDRWRFDDVIANDGEDEAEKLLREEMPTARTRSENPVSETEETALWRQLMDIVGAPRLAGSFQQGFAASESGE